MEYLRLNVLVTDALTLIVVVRVVVTDIVTDALTLIVVVRLRFDSFFEIPSHLNSICFIIDFYDF